MWWRRVDYDIVKSLDGLSYSIVMGVVLFPFFFGGKKLEKQILEIRFISKLRAIEYIKILKIC